MEYIKNLKKELQKHHTNINFSFNKINQIPKIKSDFISSSILNEIKKYKNIVLIDLPLIEIKVLYNNKLPIKQIQNIVNRFYCMLSFLDSNNINYNRNKFKLLLIPTIAKKKLPNKGKLINCHHVNSGSSYIYQNDMMVWRQEECEKVFLHELFHCLGFDRFAIENYNIPEVKLINHKNYNEGYNELCACIYNCCFQSIEKNKDVLEIFKLNKLHSLHQIKQLLQHNNFTSINELKHKVYLQDASVFSYYILKGIYLHNLNKIFKSSNNIYLYPIRNHKDKMILINKFIFKDHKFDNFIKFLIKNNNYKPNYTMRMTI